MRLFILILALLVLFFIPDIWVALLACDGIGVFVADGLWFQVNKVYVTGLIQDVVNFFLPPIVEDFFFVLPY